MLLVKYEKEKRWHFMYFGKELHVLCALEAQFCVLGLFKQFIFSCSVSRVNRNVSEPNSEYETVV